MIIDKKGTALYNIKNPESKAKEIAVDTISGFICRRFSGK
jgi:hypothetical protein